MKLTRNKMLAGIFAILIVVAVAFSQTAGNSDRMWGRGLGPGRHMLGFFTHSLNLTDAQQAQIKQIMEKEKPTIQPLIQQIGQGRQQLRVLETSDTFDETKVRSLIAQNSQAITELIVQKARIESELIQVLTPEQKAKFVQLMERRHAHFHNSADDTAQPPQS